MSNAPLKRILAPVDLSSCSRAALELACRLGAALEASVEVLYVQTSEGSKSGPNVGPSPSTALAAAHEELHRFVQGVTTVPKPRLSERVETGDARERIVAIADAEGHDAIVLGTHGRTGRPRSLAGSVAESVVRTASCPVITVREPR